MIEKEKGIVKEKGVEMCVIYMQLISNTDTTDLSIISVVN